MDIIKDIKHKEANPDKLGRIIVFIMSLLGAIGLLALVYFPLKYLN